MGSAFIARFLKGATVYLSNPTWGNHRNIFGDEGVEWKYYRCGTGTGRGRARAITPKAIRVLQPCWSQYKGPPGVRASYCAGEGYRPP